MTVLGDREDTAYWHILWTVYSVPMPTNSKRTAIGGLYEFYEQLRTYEIEYEVSQPIVAVKHSSNVQPQRPLSNSQFIEVELKKLTSIDGDRVAGNLPILDLLVVCDRVELLVQFSGNNLVQKVGRLKSRTATLLSFLTQGQAGGKNTWSKGIWYGKSTDKRFVELLQDRIRHLKHS